MNTPRDRYQWTSTEGLQELADAGDAEAQYHLGLRHYKGQDAPKDARVAFALWSKAAQLNHALAQNNLGFLYGEGEGTGRNDKMAFFWYRKAALQGNDMGQVNVGKLYQRGAGTPRDLKEARSWYEKSAAQGNSEAESLLLSMPKGTPVWKKAIAGLVAIATLPWGYYCIRYLTPSPGVLRLAVYILMPLGLTLLFLFTGKKKEEEPIPNRRAARAAQTGTRLRAATPTPAAAASPSAAGSAPAAGSGAGARAHGASSNGQAQAPSQDITTWSRLYLEPKKSGRPYPADQFAYNHVLDDARLDFSVASLDHVDTLLDAIRKKDKPEFNAFIDPQKNQNFLLVLCFYVGEVMTRNSGRKITWLDYDSMIRAIPDNGAMFPRCFQTVVTCIVEKKGFFVPLSSICTRLFEDPPDKSVRFSAEGFM